MNNKVQNRAVSLLLALFMLLVPVSVLAESYSRQGSPFVVNIISPDASDITTERLANGDYLNTIGTRQDSSSAIVFTFDLGDGGGTNHIATSELKNYIGVYTSETLSADSLVYMYGQNSELTLENIGPQQTLNRGVRMNISVSGLAKESTYYLAFLAGMSGGSHGASIGNNNIIFKFSTLGDTSRVDAVALNETDLVLDGLGQSFDLEETITPGGALNKNVSWTSADPSVATVDANGLVTGVAAGTTTVTVTTEDNAKTASCKVAVRDTDNARVLTKVNGAQSIASSGVNFEFNAPELYKEQGSYVYVLLNEVKPNEVPDIVLEAHPNGGRQSTSFKVTLFGDRDLTETLATSGNGLSVSVYDSTRATVSLSEDAVKNGGTQYLCFDKQSTSGSVWFGENVLVEITTVYMDTSKVDSVSLDESDLVLDGIGQRYDLTETVSPATAANKNVTWTSADPSVASVDANGVVTGKAAGKTQITVTTEDGAKTAVCNIQVRDTDGARVLKKAEGYESMPNGGMYMFKEPELYKELDAPVYVILDPVNPENVPAVTMFMVPDSSRISSVFVVGLYGDRELTDKIADRETGLSVAVTDYVTATVTPDASLVRTGATQYICFDKSSYNGASLFGEDVLVEFTTTGEESEIPVQSVTVDPSEAALKTGKTASLLATVLPKNATVDTTVTWTSSDASVASVDSNGTVTANRAGSAVITAKAGDKTATCKVTVTDPKNGFIKDADGVIRLYEDDNVATGVTDVKYDPKTGNWYNTVKGIVTAGPTVAPNAAGWWYIDKSGKVDFNYTGLASNAAGTWYCKNAKVDFSVTGVVYDSAHGEWVNVVNNKLTPGPTVAANAAGWWYVDKNGRVDFSHYGVEHNAAGWWAVRAGQVDFKFNGLASNAAGTWVCQNSKVNFNYNGNYTYNGRTYKVSGGKVTGTA